ncbi:MAG: lipopolysaccharide transport periplasmic protein LptA [Betaproteobacteria bacterium]|nr:lipopolysaccharide transport periplasmic protein LptA [Betaproteobacteria bacterium]
MKNPSPSGERAGAARGAPRLPRRRVVLLAWCLLCALPAYAERADRTKPLNLEADRMTVEEAKQTATFEGNVILTQGTLTIRGERMIVQQDASGFKHGAAYGNLASFRQKREGFDEYIEGYAERIEYDGKADKLQMFNRAYLKKSNDEVRGNYISYDATTEFFRVAGGGKQAATPGNPEGRVRVVIQPKAKGETPAGAPPLPLQSAPDVANPRETPAGAAR